MVELSEAKKIATCSARGLGKKKKKTWALGTFKVPTITV